MDQLLAFVAVAEELHYGRAAIRLSMTQPPLSRRIQLLEREVGAELFDRSRRSVRLTPAGRVFLADARRILHLSQEATLSARRTSQGEAGMVTLGFTAASAYSFLERVLAAARTELPGVELVLREMVSASQLEALLSGAIDAGMVRPPAAGADIATAHLFDEPLLAALPEGHPLALRGADPEVADFDGRPLVMYSPSEARYFHEVLVGIFREAGVTPEYVQYLTQVHTVLALVRSGLGTALVPAAAAALEYGGVVLRPVRGIAPRPVELELAWRRSNDNPALAALLGVVRRVADETERAGAAGPVGPAQA